MEHVHITIFLNVGAVGGALGVYAIAIVNTVKIFYKKNLTFFVSLLIDGNQGSFFIICAHCCLQGSLNSVMLVVYNISQCFRYADIGVCMGRVLQEICGTCCYVVVYKPCLGWSFQARTLTSYDQMKIWIIYIYMCVWVF